MLASNLWLFFVDLFGPKTEFFVKKKKTQMNKKKVGADLQGGYKKEKGFYQLVANFNK